MKRGNCGAFLTDLPTAFDCLLHDLLIAQLHAYCLETDSSIYTTINIGNKYNTQQETLFGVSQSSILGHGHASTEIIGKPKFEKIVGNWGCLTKKILGFE